MFAQLGYYICVPFAWLTRLFYTWTGSYGVALILFTLVIKLILLPFQMKSKRSMVRMGRLSNKQQELLKQYQSLAYCNLFDRFEEIDKSFFRLSSLS